MAPTDLCLIVDAFVRHTDTFDVPRPSDDPEAVDALIATMVDGQGAVLEVREYRLDDCGRPQWSEWVGGGTAQSWIVDLMRSAVS